MDTTLKSQWITALRSGDFTQGQCVLRSTSEQYCCFGVLCTLLPFVSFTEDTESFDSWTGYVAKFDILEAVPDEYQNNVNNALSLPDSVCRFLDIKFYDLVRLEHMNDSGHTFDQIANYIEGNL
jgi:hypothetical protein